MNTLQHKLYRKLFGATTRLSLYEKLADYLDDEVSLVETLEKFQQRFAKRKDYRAAIIGEWLNGIRNGRNFQTVMMGWVPPSERMLIAGGEESGHLAGGLREAMYATEASRRIQKAIVAALIGPFFLLMAFAGLLAGLSMNLVPILEKMLPVEKWPGHSQVYRIMANTVKDDGIVIAVVIIALFAVAVASMPRIRRGRLRSMLDRIPPYSLYRTVNSASFLVSMASQLSSGVPVEDSIRNINRLATTWMRSHTQEMLRRLAQGMKPGVATDTGLLDEEMADDVMAYSETSNFSNAIAKLGRRTVERTINRVTVISNVVKVIALLLLGSLIIWTIFSFGGVILALSDSISRTWVM